MKCHKPPHNPVFNSLCELVFAILHHLDVKSAILCIPYRHVKGKLTFSFTYRIYNKREKTERGSAFAYIQYTSP